MLNSRDPLRVSLPGDGVATRYAKKLLGDLGASVTTRGEKPDCHPARRWADSGLMALTGHPHGAPRLSPVPLASCADGALDAFRVLAGTGLWPEVAGAQLLAERAAINGYQRNGSVSPGGHCRLLKTRTGHIAVNLTRQEDWDALPAWLGGESAGNWQSVRERVSAGTTHSLVEQGRLLGLAVVDAEFLPVGRYDWMRLRHCASPRSGTTRRPRVLDLSALWAGPLCSHLWQAAGADVTKVESSRRPDGARAGSPEFFALLNHGKRSLVLDLHREHGQRQLRQHLAEADIVLEGSRPRALRQMGIVAEEIIRDNPGLTWVSISGYGRREPQANWIAYGDDAAVAAGLSAALFEASGEWLICGDAIADPLAGLHAAVAGWASWRAGGGRLVELSLEATVRHCILATAPATGSYRERQERWLQYLEEHRISPRPPQRRNGSPASAH